MLTKEIIRQVRRIEIKTRKIVDENLAGQYHSAFKGQGMEFAEVRGYEAGDDIRSIDWNVTARAGAPFVKKFTEERELTVMVVVDMSGSLEYGSNEKTKRQLAAELTALFAFSAIRNQDKVGCLIFTDQVELFIPPKKGKRHVLRLVREILAFEPKRVKTDIGGALRFLSQVQKRKAVVILVSDFLIADYKEDGCDRGIRHIARRHDLIALAVNDPLELDPPQAGLFTLEDGENGGEFIVDFGSAKVRMAFKKRADELLRRRHELFRKAGVDCVQLLTHQPFEKPLINFFKMRELRR